MPKQNRVTPLGDIVAVPGRGTMMGNRGQLHDESGRIKRSWQVRRWIACVLAFKGRKRQVMRPGYYTELFFLDEATALAAGHRPCAECRRVRFNAFREAWRAAHGGGGSPLPTAEVMDDRLHAERVGPDGSKRTFTAALGNCRTGWWSSTTVWGTPPIWFWAVGCCRGRRRGTPGGSPGRPTWRSRS